MSFKFSGLRACFASRVATSEGCWSGFGDLLEMVLGVVL